MNPAVRSIVLMAVLALTGGAGAQTDEEAVAAADSAEPVVVDDVAVAIDRTPQRCVHVTRIRSTHIASDRNIVFEMSGKKYLSNVMELDCPGLVRADRFMYEARAGSLCRGHRLCNIHTSSLTHCLLKPSRRPPCPAARRRGQGFLTRSYTSSGRVVFSTMA